MPPRRAVTKRTENGEKKTELKPSGFQYVTRLTFTGSYDDGIEDVDFKLNTENQTQTPPGEIWRGMADIELKGPDEYLVEVSGVYDTSCEVLSEITFTSSKGKTYTRKPEDTDEYSEDEDLEDEDSIDAEDREEFHLKAGDEMAIYGLQRKGYRIRSLFTKPAKSQVPIKALNERLAIFEQYYRDSQSSYLQGQVIKEIKNTVIAQKLGLPGSYDILVREGIIKTKDKTKTELEKLKKEYDRSIDWSRFAEVWFFITNISFISYNVYEILQTDFDSDDHLLVASWLSRLFEGGMIAFYLLTAMYYTINGCKPIALDALRGCGSVSSLRLVYQFGPSFVLGQLSDSRNRKVADIKKIEALKDRKQRNKKAKKAKKGNNGNEEGKAHIRGRLKGTQNKIVPIPGKDAEDSRQMKSHMMKVKIDDIENYIIPGISGIVAMFMASLFVIFAVASLVVKLSELKFVSDDYEEWDIYNVLTLLAFYNQLAGMTNVNTIQMDTIYTFVFAGDDKIFDSSEVNKMQILDYKLKKILIEEFNWYGTLFAFSLKPLDLQKVLLKDTRIDDSAADTKSLEQRNTFIYSRPVGGIYEALFEKIHVLYKSFNSDDSCGEKCLNYCQSCCVFTIMFSFTFGLGGMGYYTLLGLWEDEAEVLDCFNDTVLQANSIANVIMGIAILVFTICNLYYDRQSQNFGYDYEREEKLEFIAGCFVIYTMCHMITIQVCGYILSADVFTYDDTCQDLIADEDYWLPAILNWNVVNAFLSTCLCCTFVCLVIFDNED